MNPYDPQRGCAVQATEEQQAIVMHPSGPALVLAGAGSGKTTTLLLRIRTLIEYGADPRTILMMTFSRRGAADMRQRAALLGVPAGVQYRTLHSVAYEIIRHAPTKRGAVVPKAWQIARVIREELVAIERELGPRARRSLPHRRDVLREIGMAKAHMIWPDEVDRSRGSGEVVKDGSWTSTVEDKVYPQFAEWAMHRKRLPLDDFNAEVVARCYDALERACAAPESAGFDQDAEVRWVTFDDMVALVGRAVLRCEEWVKPWYGRFPYVLVDEVQDNAPVNWPACEFLAGPWRHVMAVGDDMQSIFGFRGAQPELMRTFLERHPDAQVYPLSRNFRSGQVIIDAANSLLGHADDRMTPDLVCGTGREGMISGVGYGDPEHEASEVVGSVLTDIRDGIDPDDIAVLYRINACSGPLEIEAIKAGLPYRIAGSSFFRRGEIKAAIGYIGACLDPDDEDSWKACANAPTRYLGRRFFNANPTLSVTKENRDFGELGRWSSGVRRAIRAIEKVRGRLDLGGAKGIHAALDYVFEDLGVRKHFREEGAQDDDMTDVDEACAALIHCASTLADPNVLVEYAKGMASTAIEDFNGDRDRIPRVTFSSIHKAKGLEWPLVYVIAASPGVLPLSNAPLEEERRLFYVAQTRAKDRCHISWAELSSHGQAVGPSQFVGEAGLLPAEDSDSDGEDPVAKAAAEF